MSIWTTTFWKAAAERAIKSAAQSAVALLSVDGIGLLDVDWTQTASVSGLMALLSLLTSVASSGIGGEGPSLTTAETVYIPQHAADTDALESAPDADVEPGEFADLS